MSSTTRKQAPRLAKPAVRYWKGKAPKGLTDVNSDSDAEEEQSNFEEGDIPINDHDDEEGEEGFIPKQEIVKPRAINLALKDVSVSQEGKVIVAGREESGRTLEEDEGMELALSVWIHCSRHNLDSDEPSEDIPRQGQDETQEVSTNRWYVFIRIISNFCQSSEYESDSDEEPQVEFRPVFIPKYVN